MSVFFRSAKFIYPRLARDENGTAAVQFALILPLLLLLTVGLIDIGRFVWVRTTLEHVTREGTRWAAVRGATNPFPATKASIEAYVAQRTVGIADDDLDIDVSWQPNNITGSRVTVAITVGFNFLVAGFLNLEPMQLSSASTMVIS
ncbi:MAG: TadE/TadG family type IV pilus assembly protein [Alphaproteobacteria bacterium]|nr:TadE/TadG family type IV pilus assembly protein [Alphaproteobacteria bacterium]